MRKFYDAGTGTEAAGGTNTAPLDIPGTVNGYLQTATANSTDKREDAINASSLLIKEVEGYTPASGASTTATAILGLAIGEIKLAIEEGLTTFLDANKPA